ncbi:hypothetical protein Barb6XT_00321 [Bacteroidales bacterium Barb6XT]|nr:hypothetical protein Barb6XT_00321 [Bacteroidales bacterium Barb6XT]
MKNVKKWSVAAVAALFLLTSCLGDTASNSGSNSAIAVVRYDLKSGKLLLDTNSGTLYAPEVETMGFADGDCITIAFSYDFGSPENVNAEKNGYLFVSLSATQAIDKGSVSFVAGDTTALLSAEFALSKAVLSTAPSYFAYLNDNLFLVSSYKGLSGQKNRWTLFADASQTPVKENGNNAYTLFLRVAKVDDGKTPEGAQTEINAYNVGDFIRRISQKEQAEGNKGYSLKIFYINEIKEDGTFTWAFNVIEAAVPQEE